MQKFGLQRRSPSLPNAIELELAKEQASSLGRAGRKLRLSLEAFAEFEASQSEGSPRSNTNDHLKKISNNVWELMLQREFVGFVEGNLKWVKANYKIPEQALLMLGKV